jgi:membrane fusion protein (multidrug efflux system)
MWVTAYVDETQAPRVKTGAEVEVRLDAFPAKAFVGHVAVVNATTGDALSLAPTNTLPGTTTRVLQRVPVKITLDAADAAIKPGMSAVVKIAASRR